MKKKEKFYVFIISFIITLLKSIFFIPVYINGGFTGLINKFGYISLMQYYFADVSCADCFYYEIIGYRMVIETIFCFGISLLLCYFILKIIKNIGSR